MRLISTVFEAGATIPVRYTCEAENISPPLEWDAVPEGTKSLALLMDDPDAPAEEPFSHWVLYNIPPEVDSLPEDFQPGADWEGQRGRNSMGKNHYEGPCPPIGVNHRYYFRLYALDTKLNLGEGATRAQIMDAMHEHILEETELAMSFTRSESSIAT